MTIHFSGSSASVSMLTYMFGTSQFQDLKDALVDAQSDLKGAASDLADATAAHAAANAAAVDAAAAHAAARKVADGLKALLDECLDRKSQAEQRCHDIEDNLDECRNKVVSQTGDAIRGAGDAVRQAGEDVATGTAIGTSGSGGAKDKLDEAKDKLNEAKDLAEDGEYDDAQAAAQEAKDLAEDASGESIGCSPEGATTSVARGEPRVSAYTRKGVTGVTVSNWRGMRGLPADRQRAVLDAMMRGISTSLGAADVGALLERNLASYAYGQWQDAAVEAIAQRLEEWITNGTFLGYILWVDVSWDEEWTVSGTQSAQRYQDYQCIDGSWKDIGEHTEITVEEGECLYSAGGTERVDFDLTDNLYLDDAIPLAIEEVLKDKSWVVGSCE